MDLMLEIYCKGKHLSIDSQDLRQEDFYKEHNVSTHACMCIYSNPGLFRTGAISNDVYKCIGL